MKKRLFLSSMLIMSVAQAIAEPSNTGTFPTNGLMQEDYTYTNAATETNMGVYEGSVNATAEYTDILYKIAAGKYLPAGAEETINCDVPGSFCPGSQTDVLYNENNAQGLTSCSTATNGAYTLSDGNGSSADSCYRQCSGNVSIAHATGVKGFDYYGNGVDTCEPTGCENGWHLSNGDFAGLNIDKTIDYTQRYAKADAQYRSDGVGACSDELGTSEDCNTKPEYAELGVNEFVSVYSYGRIYGVATCSSTASENDLVSVYMENGVKLQNGEISQEEFVASLLAVGTPEQDERIMESISDYSNGNITESELTNIFFSEFGIITSNNIDTNSHGSHCWCKFNGYTPNGGTRQNISSDWVNIPDYDASATYESCMSFCVFDCAFDTGANGSYSAHYDALMDSFGETLSVCDANKIKINWTGADAKDISDNNAGIATYNEDIRTPVKAQTIKGKTFKGWRFSNPTQTNLPK